MAQTDLDLSTTALKKDLDAAQRSLGVTVRTAEEQTASPGGRVSTGRVHHVTLASATSVRARFVRQGWAELAKKMFVKEVEVGEKSFDDAVYIATDTQDAVRTLLGHPRVREALMALVSKDCIVDVKERELVVAHPDAHGRSDDEVAEALAIAAHL
ncbi:MAG: hypothetical protein K1X94_32000 [Sandaracinaceae bacterium]|nr:hypothetical protein [Sandaracinaceae bacterium]